jgi:PAS domain S-box-containing protein
MPIAALAPLFVASLTGLGESRGALEPDLSRGTLVVGLTILLSALLYLSAADVSRSAARRAQSERELLQSETRLRLAQSSGHVGVWELEAASGAVSCTPELASLYGLIPAQLTRYEQWRERVHPDDIDGVEQSLRSALAGGGRFDIEFRIRHPSGATRWILARGQLVAGEQDGVPRVLGVNVDVTDHRLAAEALRQAHDQLLEQDRSKDEYLAVLSHELRNPLAPITNSLYVLERAEPGSDVHDRALAIAIRQVGQLSRLVGDLLDATRLSRGKVVLQPRRIDLNELAAHAAEDHRALFAEAGVSLELCRAASPVPVQADWNRMGQAIGNLLQNAAKFTRRGDAVTVAVGSEPATGRAEIRVTDTGPGLSADVLARLFQPFAQASATLDRSRGGLGLGLALVKGLVELHGGEVHASSPGEGRGSTFLVRLPLALAATETARATSGSPGPRRRVLIIEDKADAAASLRDRLEIDGHEVAVAADGSEGLARASTMRPDVVLCDIGLPGLDGYGVARAMRADAALGRTLLVALTGYALPTDRDRALEAGFDGHLAKPPDQEMLNAVLRDLRVPPAP